MDSTEKFSFMMKKGSVFNRIKIYVLIWEEWPVRFTDRKIIFFNGRKDFRFSNVFKWREEGFGFEMEGSLSFE